MIQMVVWKAKSVPFADKVMNSDLWYEQRIMFIDYFQNIAIFLSDAI